MKLRRRTRRLIRRIGIGLMFAGALILVGVVVVATGALNA